MLAPFVTNFATLTSNSLRNYIALDRDNTLIEDAGYTKLNQEPTWLPGVIEGLKLIHSRNFGLVILTNQAALSKGIFDLPKLEEFHKRMNLSLIDEAGFGFNSIIVCPHSRDQSCFCRKPQPGMFHSAQEMYGQLPQVMIGDSESDMQAAKSVGVQTLKTSQEDFLKVISSWISKL